jgi:hypothetical protein
VLSDFIAWGVGTFPADRYALIFWDHGGAWPGFGGDESTQDHDLLTIAELKQGTQAGMQAAGLDQFALIGFDACLMATVETVLAMRPFGEYLLASEELEPGHGWDYRYLQILKDNPSTGPVDLGNALLDGFLAQAQASGTSANVTLSLTDLYALDSLWAGVRKLAADIMGDLAGLAATVASQKAATLEFGQSPDPSRSTHMIDLGHLAENLAAREPRLQAARDQILGALQKAVVLKGGGPVTAAAKGLAIYFPPQAAYFNRDYNVLDEMGPWRDFLDTYYKAGQSVPTGQVPTFQNPDHIADTDYSNGVLTVGGLLVQGTSQYVAGATAITGVVDAESQQVYVIGDSPAEVRGDGWVLGYWNGGVLAADQGQASAYCYLSVSVEGDYVNYAIPFAYFAPGSLDAAYVMLYMVASASSGQLIQQTWYLVTDAGVGELYPQPGAQIMPIVQVVDSQGNSQWTFTSDFAFDPNQGLSFTTEVLPQGTSIYVEVDVFDFGGNGDYVYFLGALGGGGGGGDMSCDECLGQRCAATYAACNANPSCGTLLSCVASCGDDACINECIDIHAAGYQDAANLLDCAEENCDVECA